MRSGKVIRKFYIVSVYNRPNAETKPILRFLVQIMAKLYGEEIHTLEGKRKQ